MCVRKLLIFMLLSFGLASCLAPASNPTKAPITTAVDTPSVEPFETDQQNPTVETGRLPVAVQYNLGETTITQSRFPEDSRFRYMPVRLNGILAVPGGDGAPYPVVVILHGNHPGCPFLEADMLDRWPCDPEAEQHNYRGYEYLARQLAAQGYVALSININAEYTLGFGEPVPVERLEQLVDLHLEALAEATSGGPNKFGVELKGRADMSRLAFIGHSQGGEGAYWLTQKGRLDAPDAFAKLGYGPVYGLLLVAPAANLGGARGARVPLAVILPACDSDVFQQEGQLFYEITRLDPEQRAWASSVWLEGANHNYFNETLLDEAVSRPGRPDCEPLLKPGAQRNFLSEYAIDFLAKAFNQDPVTTARLGMDFQAQAPDKLYGQPALVAALAPRPDRLPLLLPADRSELKTNLAGGSVTNENLMIVYCEEGYYVPSTKPGSEPCKRVNLVIPGNPAMIVVSWSQRDGAMRFSLLDDTDMSQFTAISLRAAIDPLSNLNQVDTNQAFTIQLVDKQGVTASVHTRIDEPALRFPDGSIEENDTFDGGWFTGRVPLTSIRMPLGDFSGVNLAEIREILLFFDQTPSGTLFISDLELVR